MSSRTKTLMMTTKSLVTVRSPMLDAPWSSAAPAQPGSTLLVPKWKGLQYLTCGTVHCVKQKVQKVELNLEQEKQEAGSLQVQVLLLRTFSGRTAVKRSRSDLWSGKLRLIWYPTFARRGLWYEPPLICNYWKQIQLFPPRIVSRTFRVIHKDFYQC